MKPQLKVSQKEASCNILSPWGLGQAEDREGPGRERMGSLKGCNERKIKLHRSSFLLTDGHRSPLRQPRHWACAITSGLEVSLLPSVHMRAELRGQIQEWPQQGPALGLPWAHVRKSLSLSGPGTAGIRPRVSSPRALGPTRGPKLRAQEGTGATIH